MKLLRLMLGYLWEIFWFKYNLLYGFWSWSTVIILEILILLQIGNDSIIQNILSQSGLHLTVSILKWIGTWPVINHYFWTLRLYFIVVTVIFELLYHKNGCSDTLYVCTLHFINTLLVDKHEWWYLYWYVFAYKWYLRSWL